MSELLLSQTQMDDIATRVSDEDFSDTLELSADFVKAEAEVMHEVAHWVHAYQHDEFWMPRKQVLLQVRIAISMT